MLPAAPFFPLSSDAPRQPKVQTFAEASDRSPLRFNTPTI